MGSGTVQSDMDAKGAKTETTVAEYIATSPKQVVVIIDAMHRIVPSARCRGMPGAGGDPIRHFGERRAVGDVMTLVDRLRGLGAEVKVGAHGVPRGACLAGWSSCWVLPTCLPACPPACLLDEGMQRGTAVQLGQLLSLH